MNSEEENFYEKWKDKIGKILDHFEYFLVINQCFYCNFLNKKVILANSEPNYLLSFVLEPLSSKSTFMIKPAICT